MRYAIRARMDPAVARAAASIGEEQWRPLVQRKRIGDEADAQLDFFASRDGQTLGKGRWLYRAIATIMDDLDDSQVVHFYHARGEHSENRIKELRSDFAGARPPCPDFRANAAWLMISALACNLPALMRMALPARFRTARAGTIRTRLYCIAGQIVRHARRTALKVARSSPDPAAGGALQQESCR